MDFFVLQNGNFSVHKKQNFSSYKKKQKLTNRNYPTKEKEKGIKNLRLD